ncbi:hypothetical protein B0H34DRAFT_794142 [Crassisporium funariophilum]|nr:hypothetical protein B0H34DRAFT_794142 [Crassisporium funariophilum]
MVVPVLLAKSRSFVSTAADIVPNTGKGCSKIPNFNCVGFGTVDEQHPTLPTKIALSHCDTDTNKVFLTHPRQAKAFRHFVGFRRNPDKHLKSEELAASNQNPFNLEDTSLFVEVPDSPQSIHNNLSPLAPGSPLFTEAKLSVLSSPPNSDTQSPKLETIDPPLQSLTSSPLTPISSSSSYQTKPTSPTSNNKAQDIKPKMTVQMPPRGDRGAPRFDSAQPREPGRFFSDLEFLFKFCNVTAEKDKKEHATRYLSVEDSDIWMSVTEYKDINKTFTDFKDTILQLYPSANDLFRHTMNDIDMLVGTPTAESDLQRAYVRGFQPSLWIHVINRLQHIVTKLAANPPYKIDDVYQAASWVLQANSYGSVGNTMAFPAMVPVQPLQPIAPTPEIKVKSISSILAEFTKNLTEVLAKTSQSHHFIRECKLVAEYIRTGKCKRNTEGKVVLSTGAFVPRNITGANLKERVDKWHRRNPNQLTAGSLFNPIESTSNTSPSADNMFSHQTYKLTAGDQIASLEAELFNLKARKQGFTPTVRTRGQKARAAAEADKDDIPRDTTTPTPPTRAPTQPPTAPIPATPPIPALQPVPATATVPAQTAPQPQTPTHPFRNANNASYITPRKPRKATSNKTAGQRKEPAYRTLPPIYDAKVATDIYTRSMDTPVTLTQRELLLISPKEGTAQAAIMEEHEEQITSNLRSRYTGAPQFLIGSQRQVPEPGATIIGNMYDIYYRSLRLGEEPDPDQIVVAKDSSALRSIFPIVNNDQKVECILNSGCQIVAMSEDVCHDLGLSYDPTIRLRMVSANGSIDMSLGLACNVPFKLGIITFYMQVHIIRAPAYDILIGRPFDTLTASVIRNYPNEDQTIMLHDPNTGQIITVPTSPRTPDQELMDDEGEIALSIVLYEKRALYIEAFRLLDSSPTDYSHSYLTACDLSHIPVPDTLRQRPEFTTLFLNDSSDTRSPNTMNFVQYTESISPTNNIPPPKSQTRTHRTSDRLSELPTFASPFVPSFLAKKKYKPVAKKIRPVFTGVDKKLRIICNIKGDPLATLPTLPTHPPPFKPYGRYTRERYEEFDKANNFGFLWQAERDLLHHFVTLHQDGFA